MRIIICGAGQVGYSIASYLAREDNDVIVIDQDAELIRQINNELDVSGIVGHAAHPDILEQAGASQADMIVAVTHADEVNMVACQVAHSLFGVPKKIARVRAQSYRAPAWSNLFSRAHMPIDTIISPEVEVAEEILNRLSIPGTMNVISLADGRAHLAGVICNSDCPVLHTQIRQLETLFPDLPMEISLIVRKGKILIPDYDEQLIQGDEVYFFTDAEHLTRVLAAFGHEEQKAHNICIMGGGNIGLYLAKLIEKEYKKARIMMIERNPERALMLSKELPNVIVINGDGLQHDILREANIENTETLIAITNDDETNILGSLLAKQYGCGRVITLVNKPNYTSLINALGIDAVVTPRASTVSTIMQYVRRGKVKAVHTLRDGVAEVIEAEVSDTSSIANKKFKDLRLPKDIDIGAIVRKDKVYMPKPDFVIEPEDHVVVLAKEGHAKEVEKFFTVQVDLF